MKRVLSGIRANSDLTLGNYLGALKPWVALQPGDTGSPQDTEYFFFIPTLHSLVGRPDPTELRTNTLSNAAWFIAAGLDPAKVTLYVQSQIPAHSELYWILGNFTTLGELSRMTQYKDKLSTATSLVEKRIQDRMYEKLLSRVRSGEFEGLVGLSHDSQVEQVKKVIFDSVPTEAVRESAESLAVKGGYTGVFNYPVLMAADILLYDADEVPVGDDQTQHVELARDIAQRFNNLYGETFKLPKATKPVAGARVMNLQDPGRKMSKSDEDQSGNIMLSDSPEEIRNKIKRAVTDSGSEVKAGEDKPAITNLLDIYSAITGRKVSEIEQEYEGKGYGDFKAGLADAVVEHLEPIQQRHDELMNDTEQLLAILNTGREKAAVIAEEKLSQVKSTLGLL